MQPPAQALIDSLAAKTERTVSAIQHQNAMLHEKQAVITGLLAAHGAVTRAQNRLDESSHIECASTSKFAAQPPSKLFSVHIQGQHHAMTVQVAEDCALVPEISVKQLATARALCSYLRGSLVMPTDTAVLAELLAVGNDLQLDDLVSAVKEFILSEAEQ